MMKSPTFLLITMAAAVLNATPATAQPYPSKPVRIITPNSPGGTSDVFVRALADELQKRWAQPVPRVCRFVKRWIYDLHSAQRDADAEPIYL